MYLVIKLNPNMTIARFHELERQLKRDYGDAITYLQLEGDESEPN